MSDLFAPAVLRILLIEDDRNIAEVLSRRLQKEGGEVLIAHSLATSRVLMPEAHVVMLDLCLPDGHGLESLRAARAMTDRPIVVITGSSYVGSRADERAIMAGAQDWIDKTSIPCNLLQILRLAVVRDRVTRLKETAS